MIDLCDFDQMSSLSGFGFEFLSRRMMLSFLDVEHFSFYFYFFVLLHLVLLDHRAGIGFYCLNYLGNNFLVNVFFNWSNLTFLRLNYF
jgi:hypothetical protein